MGNLRIGCVVFDLIAVRVIRSIQAGGINGNRMKWLVVSLWIATAGCGADQAIDRKASSQPASQSMTQGAKLASIEAGYIVANSEPSSKWFDDALKKMTVTYGEDEVGISDGLVQAQKLLKKSGVRITLRTLAETMGGVAKGTGTRDFNSIAASYIMMRKNGVSHSEASYTIQGLSEKMD